MKKKYLSWSNRSKRFDEKLSPELIQELSKIRNNLTEKPDRFEAGLKAAGLNISQETKEKIFELCKKANVSPDLIVLEIIRNQTVVGIRELKELLSEVKGIK